MRVKAVFKPETEMHALQAGEFKYTGLHGSEGIYGIAFGCPCGCDGVSALSFNNHPK